MGEDPIWQPLRDAILRLEREGRSLRLWLRDDDAVEPTEALDRLLSLTAAHHVPLNLAVIPAFTGAALAARLASAEHASVTVHGWSHENHAPAGSKKRELGPDRPAGIVLDELRNGFLRLRTLYPTKLQPVLVPPWNRIDAALLPALADIGFQAVSVYGKAKADAPLRQINSHVDIMDWHGTGGCLPHGQLVSLLVSEIEDRMNGSDEPIGILTHHLVHDAYAWAFLTSLFENCRSSWIRWQSLGQLLD